MRILDRLPVDGEHYRLEIHGESLKIRPFQIIVQISVSDAELPERQKAIDQLSNPLLAPRAWEFMKSVGPITWATRRPISRRAERSSYLHDSDVRYLFPFQLRFRPIRQGSHLRRLNQARQTHPPRRETLRDRAQLVCV
jgi:hypothetical protein